jgi:predicted TIM-barrel fold metal-dependent hydrolase
MAGTGIIDAHVHLYPAEVSADPVGWATRMGEPLWAALVTPQPGRRVQQGWADVDRLLRDMDAAGVERAILLGWYWQRHETCVWHNHTYASCVRAHPDRLSAFATVQAGTDATAALAEMTRARDDGLIGLGELNPWSGGGSPLGEAWLAVFARASEMSWPVNLHVTDPASRMFPGRVATPLEDVVALAEKLPELRLILAHWGGGLIFHELNTRARRALRNCLYDTAATPLLYDPAIYAAAVRAVGAERILFGSDYPLMVFPKEQREPDFTRMLTQIREAGLDEATLAAVLGGSARRLLRRDF